MIGFCAFSSGLLGFTKGCPRRFPSGFFEVNDFSKEESPSRVSCTVSRVPVESIASFLVLMVILSCLHSGSMRFYAYGSPQGLKVS